MANHQADFARSEPFAEETVRLVQGAEAGGEGTRPWITAAAKAFLAEALVYQQRFAKSRVLFDEATAQARDIGEFTLLGAVRFMAGMGAMLQGDLAEATVALAEGANAYRETGGPFLSTSLIGLGEIALRTGDANGAARHLREALGSAQAIGYRRNIPEALLDLGLLARVVGQPERSARLFGAAEALRCALKLQISVRQRESYEETVNAVRTALGHSRFRQAWAEGQAMTPDQAITYALGADDEAASRARA